MADAHGGRVVRTCDQCPDDGQCSRCWHADAAAEERLDARILSAEAAAEAREPEGDVW